MDELNSSTNEMSGISKLGGGIISNYATEVRLQSNNLKITA